MTLAPGDTSCAADVPPLRLVPHFALHASQLDPAAAARGNHADAAQLRQVSAAVVAPAMYWRASAAIPRAQGVGLRGGSFRIVNDPSTIHVTLDQVRWTEDLAVSGKIDKPLARTGTVHAALHFAGPPGPPAISPSNGRKASAAAVRRHSRHGWAASPCSRRNSAPSAP